MTEKSKPVLSDLPEHLRRIRSFVLREGRLTKGQQAIARAVQEGRVRFETIRIDFDD